MFKEDLLMLVHRQQHTRFGKPGSVDVTSDGRLRYGKLYLVRLLEVEDRAAESKSILEPVSFTSHS